MTTTNLPLWFLQWWEQFGCLPEFLQGHPLVENGFLLFKQHYQPTPSEKKFSPLLLFYTKFFVPCLCSWYYDYNLQNGSLVFVRKFKIKWWDYFVAENKSSKSAVEKWLKTNKIIPAIQQNQQSNFFSLKR